MTTDQRAALEILLDAQNVLDTDTQLMPLIRFVLFGTTGTVKPDSPVKAGQGKKKQKQESEGQGHKYPVYFNTLGDALVARCVMCDSIVATFDREDHPSQETMISIATERGKCPNCGESFE